MKTPKHLLVAVAVAVPLALAGACGGGTSPECQAVDDAFESAAAEGDTGREGWTAYGRALERQAGDIPDEELREAVQTLGAFTAAMGEWDFDGPFPGPSNEEVEAATATISRRCDRESDIPDLST